MPNIDSSEYIRKLKLTAIYNANKAANQRKFRELTRFDSYDPSAVRTTGAVCNDVCVTTPKDHNIFAAQAYSASRVPHFRRSGESGGCADGIVIDFAEATELNGSIFYVEYLIPPPGTQSITFTYINIPDNVFPEIDSDTFDFQEDGSTLVVNGLSGGAYDLPYVGEYCVYSPFEGNISSGNCVTLNTNSLIEGPLYLVYALSEEQGPP
jgi:hypothetical protein